VKIEAGEGNDQIVLTASTIFAITIDGAEGSDTLIGPDTDSIWTITGINIGNVDRVVFKNIENLTGGEYDDTFVFAGLSGIAGLIDGGGGMNTLDYTAYTSNATVDLAAGIATGTAGIKNIHMVNGIDDTGFLGPIAEHTENGSPSLMMPGMEGVSEPIRTINDQQAKKDTPDVSLMEIILSNICQEGLESQYGKEQESLFEMTHVFFHRVHALESSNFRQAVEGVFMGHVCHQVGREIL